MSREISGLWAHRIATEARKDMNIKVGIYVGRLPEKLWLWEKEGPSG